MKITAKTRILSKMDQDTTKIWRVSDFCHVSIAGYEAGARLNELFHLGYVNQVGRDGRCTLYVRTDKKIDMPIIKPTLKDIINKYLGRKC